MEPPPAVSHAHDVGDAQAAQGGQCDVDPPECPERVEEPAPAKTVLPVQHGRRNRDERERAHGERAEVEALHRVLKHGIPYTWEVPVAHGTHGAEKHEEQEVEEEEGRAERAQPAAPTPVRKDAEQQRYDSGA